MSYNRSVIFNVTQINGISKNQLSQAARSVDISNTDYLLSLLRTSFHSRFIFVFSEKKELKAFQAKQSMDSAKAVTCDKTIKNKAERDRFAYEQ